MSNGTLTAADVLGTSAFDPPVLPIGPRIPQPYVGPLDSEFSFPRPDMRTARRQMPRNPQFIPWVQPTMERLTETIDGLRAWLPLTDLVAVSLPKVWNAQQCVDLGSYYYIVMARAAAGVTIIPALSTHQILGFRNLTNTQGWTLLSQLMTTWCTITGASRFLLDNEWELKYSGYDQDGNLSTDGAYLDFGDERMSPMNLSLFADCLQQLPPQLSAFWWPSLSGTDTNTLAFMSALAGAIAAQRPNDVHVATWLADKAVFGSDTASDNIRQLNSITSNSTTPIVYLGVTGHANGWLSTEAQTVLDHAYAAGESEILPAYTTPDFGVSGDQITIALNVPAVGGDTPPPASTLLSCIPATLYATPTTTTVFGAVGGPFTPATITYTLINYGGSTQRWMASNTQSWLTLSETSGTLTPGIPHTVTATIGADANNLAGGAYTDVVTFTALDGFGTTHCNVSLTAATGGPQLTVTPSGGLASSGALHGPFSPTSIVYTLTNVGGSSLNWTASKSQSWLSLSAASGTLASAASTTVTASLAAGAASLTSGSYSDTVTFTASNGTGSTTRPVTLAVAAGPALSVSPAATLAATGVAGGPFAPSSVTYTVTNVGGSDLNWSTSSSQTWLTVSNAGGALSPGATASVTVSLAAAANALASGNYSATVTFVATNGTGSTTRTATLAVSEAVAPTLQVTPNTPFAVTGFAGLEMSATEYIYTLTNTGGSTLNWSAALSDSTWLTINSATSGSLAPNASTTLVLYVIDDGLSLSAGSYSSTLTITALNGLGTTTRSATATITDYVAMTVSAGSLTATGTTGGGPVTATHVDYTLTNTGVADLHWTAAATQPWLYVSPTSGTLAASGTTTVRVAFNAAVNELAAGSYSDTVSFGATNGNGSTTRSVSLTLSAAQAPTYSQQFTDTFAGPLDQALATHNAAWTTPNNGFAISFGSVYSTVNVTGNRAAAYINTPSLLVNQYAEAGVTYSGNLGSIGLWLRGSTDGLSGYVLLTGRNPNDSAGTNSNGLRLFRIDNGVLTQLGGTYTQSVLNATIRLEANGVTLTPKINGQLVAEIGVCTDATYITQSAAGLYCAGIGDPTLNAFKAGNVVNQYAISALPSTPQAVAGYSSSWSPSELTLRLGNVGGASTSAWSAALLDADWFTLSASSGSLAVNAQTSFTLTPNAAAAAKTEGVYAATVDVTMGTQHYLRQALLQASSMTTASRTLGAAPLGVTFDAVNVTSDTWHAPNQTAAVPTWASGVIQPRGWTAQPVNCAGVTLMRCEYGTPLGSGTLTYNGSAHTLTWAAHGETAGSPVTITAGNEYSVASSGGRKIVVWVTALPSGNKSDSIVIEDGGINADWNSFSYAWDFGDASAAGDPGIQSFDPTSWYYGARKSDGTAYSKNTARGWQASHVYQSAGAYTVTLTVTDDRGATHTYKQAVTVNNGQWTTYYFANSGNDSTGDGSQNAPYATWDKARSLVGSNVRLLFKRGDTFNASAMLSYNGATSVHLGAYGSGNRPIIKAVGNITPIGGTQITDLRLVDLQVVGSQSINQQMGVNSGPHTLLLRTRIEQFYFGINAEYTCPLIVQECDLDQNPQQIREEDGGAKFSYVIWSTDQNGVALLGCYLTGFTDNIARFYSNKLTINHCTSRSFYRNRALRLQGSDPTNGRMYTGRWLGCYYNDLNTHFKITGDAAVAGTTSPVRQLRIEGNSWTQFASDTMIGLGCAEGVTVVNNRATAPDAYASALVTMDPGYSATATQPYAHRINIFNNSLYSQATSADVQARFVSIYHDPQQGYSATVDNSSVAVRVYNNILSAPTGKATVTSYFCNLDSTSGVVSPGWLLAYNDFYGPSLTSWGVLPSGAASLAQFQAAGQDLNSIHSDPQFVSSSDLRLQPASGCRSAGVDVRIWAPVDADGVALTSTPALGAYQTFSPPVGGSLGGMAITAAAPGTNTVTLTTTGASYVLTTTGIEMWRRISPLTNTVSPRKVANLAFTITSPKLTQCNSQSATVTSTEATFTFYADGLIDITSAPETGFSYTHTSLLSAPEWNRTSTGGALNGRMWSDNDGGSMLLPHYVGCTSAAVTSDVQHIDLLPGASCGHTVFPSKPFNFDALYGANAKPGVYILAAGDMISLLMDQVSTDLHDPYVDANGVSHRSDEYAIQNSLYAGTVVIWNWCYTSAGQPYKGVWSSSTTYATNDVVSYNSSYYIALQAGSNHTPDTNPTYWKAHWNLWSPYWGFGQEGLTPTLLTSYGGGTVYGQELRDMAYYRTLTQSLQARGYKVAFYLQASNVWHGQPVETTLGWMSWFKQQIGNDGWYFDNASYDPTSSSLYDWYTTYRFAKGVRQIVGENGVMIHHNSVDPLGFYSLLRSTPVDSYMSHTFAGETGLPIDDVNDLSVRYYLSGYGTTQAIGSWFRYTMGGTNRSASLSFAEMMRILPQVHGFPMVAESRKDANMQQYTDALTHLTPRFRARRAAYASNQLPVAPAWPETTWYKTLSPTVTYNNGVKATWTTPTSCYSRQPTTEEINGNGLLINATGLGLGVALARFGATGYFSYYARGAPYTDDQLRKYQEGSVGTSHDVTVTTASPLATADFPQITLSAGVPYYYRIRSYDPTTDTIYGYNGHL